MLENFNHIKVSNKVKCVSVLARVSSRSHAMEDMWRSEGNLVESILFCDHVGPTVQLRSSGLEQAPLPTESLTGLQIKVLKTEFLLR